MRKRAIRVDGRELERVSERDGFFVKIQERERGMFIAVLGRRRMDRFVFVTVACGQRSCGL